MTIDVLVALGAVLVIVVVFATRGRKQQATARSREQLLNALAPVISGTLSKNLELTGTFAGHPIEASLRTTGRIDQLGSSGYRSNSSFEVLLLVLRGARGEHPWGFYTSVDGGRIGKKWQSVITFAGAPGRMLSRLSHIPIDRGIDERLEQGGMLQALDGLEAGDTHRPYVLVSYVPDGSRAVDGILQRIEQAGGHLAERARHEAAEYLHREQGGHLRVEVERRGDDDPSPERFRAILNAAVAVATLNATINPPSAGSPQG